MFELILQICGIGNIERKTRLQAESELKLFVIRAIHKQRLKPFFTFPSS